MTMQAYMGYRPDQAKRGNAEDRTLPVCSIAGTDFMVDLECLELRQADDPHNRISIGAVPETMGFHILYYDTVSRNIYPGDTSKPEHIPARVSIILVPPLKELDPVGLARKHGLADHFYNSSPQQKTLQEIKRTPARHERKRKQGRRM